MTTPSVEERTLETLVGPLAVTVPQFQPGTRQHSDQLTTERRTNPELRNQWFYTADSALYTVEMEKGKGLLGKIKSFFGRDKEAFLYLGREPTNPIFNNIEEATQQLIRTGNYIPPKEDVEAVKSADTTLRVKLSDLRLQKLNDIVSYFEIDTDDYGSLNGHQRKVAERVYGSGEDFVKNMKMFDEAGIRKIRFYVSKPDYVKKTVKQYGSFARASRLFGFDKTSNFDAVGRLVGGHLGLRGVKYNSQKQ